MELESLKFIGIGLTSIAMLGAAIGVGNIFTALLNGIARNPSAEQQLLRSAFIGAGFVEALGLFALIIAFMLLFFV